MPSRERHDVDADSPVAAVAAFDVAAADTTDSLATLATKMTEHHIGALLLETHAGETAILTDRDLVRALAEDSDSWAADCMTRDVIICDATMSIADAAETMLVAGVRHLVVRRADGTLGVASMRDLLRPILDSLE